MAGAVRPRSATMATTSETWIVDVGSVQRECRAAKAASSRSGLTWRLSSGPHGVRARPGSAATIVLVLADPETERYRLIDQYDLGQATMAMMLAATDLGIGTGHSAVGDQEAARRILGLPDDRHAAYMLALGYPADRPLAPIKELDRRSFDDVVHRGHW